MELTVEEFNQLKEENIRLKRHVNKLRKLVNGSTLNSDLEFVVNRLVPVLFTNVEEEIDYFNEMIQEIVNCKLDYQEFLKTITLLLKINRLDLTELFVKRFSRLNSLKDNILTQDELQSSFSLFIKHILFQETIQEKHLEILFNILLINERNYISISYFDFYEQYLQELTRACLLTNNDKWLLQLLRNVCINTNNSILQKYFEYLNNHWDLIYKWITKDKLSFWKALVSNTNSKFAAKLEALYENV